MDLPTFILTVVMFLVFAGVFGGVGIWVAVSNKRKKERCTVRVDATVIENKPRRPRSRSGHRSRTTYSPVFEYVYNGITHTAETNYSSNPPTFHVGDMTDVYIDPESPNTIYVPKMKEARILSIAFIGGGVLMLLVLAMTTVSYLKGDL